MFIDLRQPRIIVVKAIAIDNVECPLLHPVVDSDE